LFDLVLPDIGEVLDKEEGEYVFLILRGIGYSPEGIAGFPGDRIDLLLCDFSFRFSLNEAGDYHTINNQYSQSPFLEIGKYSNLRY